jgi:hypothetical protein
MKKKMSARTLKAVFALEIRCFVGSVHNCPIDCFGIILDIVSFMAYRIFQLELCDVSEIGLTPSSGDLLSLN